MKGIPFTSPFGCSCSFFLLCQNSISVLRSTTETFKKNFFKLLNECITFIYKWLFRKHFGSPWLSSAGMNLLSPSTVYGSALSLPTFDPWQQVEHVSIHGQCSPWEQGGDLACSFHHLSSLQGQVPDKEIIKCLWNEFKRNGHFTSTRDRENQRGSSLPA